jgi:hypothetical protein
VMFAWFVSSEAFGDISTVDLKDLLFAEKMKQIEDDVPPFGVIEDGNNNSGAYEQMQKEMDAWNNL